MVVVEILVSRLVKPSIPPPYPFTLLQNSNLDLVIVNIYVKTVYFYIKPINGSPNFFSTRVLTHALSQALSHFYPIAGRLTPDINVACNGDGALFVEACADCTIEELGDLKPDPKLLKLVPTLDESLDITSWPLLIIQVTTFQCGGVSLGVGLEHHVADGVSALNFLNTWSDIARGKPFTALPSFDRVWLKARTPPTPQFVHDEYLRLPQPKMKKKNAAKPANGEFVSMVNGGSLMKELTNGAPTRMVKQSNGLPKSKVNFNIIEKPNSFDEDHGEEEAVVRMFELPKDFLLKMKEKYCKIVPFSTYELLAAHVWRSCCEARNLPSEEDTMLLIAVDGRARLRCPPLPENYIGNVIFSCCPVLAAGEVRAGVAATAGKVHEALKGMDDEYYRSALDFLELQPDLSKFVKGVHTFACPNLGFISWAKFPIYDCDFGWGRPIHVGLAHLPWEGHAYVLPSPSTDGSLRLCISLQRRHMQKFSEILPLLN